MPDKKQYEVGYRKPPRHTQFSKGESGNPGGRPKNARNAKTVVKNVLEKKIQVREGTRTTRMSKLEGILMRQTENALKGDPRAMLAMLKIAMQVGLLEAGEDQQQALSPTEEALLKEIMGDLAKPEE